MNNGFILYILPSGHIFKVDASFLLMKDFDINKGVPKLLAWAYDGTQHFVFSNLMKAPEILLLFKQYLK